MIDSTIDDEHWMRLALKQAERAFQVGEVPVGAVIVQHNRVIACSYNQPIATCDPTAHAEVLALRQAAKVVNNYRLVDCELYVTVEPCLMCLGAVVHARIQRLVFGACEPRAGAVVSQLQLEYMTFINHKKLQVKQGVLSGSCSDLMVRFFQSRR